MEFIEIKNPPEFTLEVERWTRKTKGNGDEMAKVIAKLLNNSIYNKSENERQEHVTRITLAASGWAGNSAPYTQTVTVSGAKESMEPILVSALADGASEDVQKAYSKAFGIVSSGTASVGDGTATFKVYKKPVVDIMVGLKGV